MPVLKQEHVNQVKRSCTCCGEVSEDQGTVVMPSGMIYRICYNCLEFLWQKRNPPTVEANKQAKKMLKNKPREK